MLSKICYKNMGYFVVTTFFYKSDLVFENGHFKNVQNGKSKKSLEKDPLKPGL
jgi:hypothetical protein